MMYLIHLEAGWESLSLCRFSLEAISPSSRLLDICMVDYFRAIGKLHHQKSMCPWLSSYVMTSFILFALKIIFWSGNKVYSSLVYIVVSFDADLRSYIVASPPCCIACTSLCYMRASVVSYFTFWHYWKCKEIKFELDILIISFGCTTTGWQLTGLLPCR